MIHIKKNATGDFYFIVMHENRVLVQSGLYSRYAYAKNAANTLRRLLSGPPLLIVDATDDVLAQERNPATVTDETIEE